MKLYLLYIIITGFSPSLDGVYYKATVFSPFQCLDLGKKIEASLDIVPKENKMFKCFEIEYGDRV